MTTTPDNLPDTNTVTCLECHKQFITHLGLRCPDCFPRDYCDLEFGEDHDHDPVECARLLDGMSPDMPDPMDDIPWGTPDSWIPDNPNEDGFCRSDFI